MECVNVDNPSYSSANWHNKDSQTQFSDNCNSLSVDDFEEKKVSVFPNPFINTISVDVERDSNYILLSATGQKIKEGKLQIGKNQVTCSELSTGLYFLNIKSQDSNITMKLIKQIN